MKKFYFEDAKNYIRDVCRDPAKQFVAELAVGIVLFNGVPGWMCLSKYNYNEALYALDGQKSFGFASVESCVAHGLTYTEKRNLKQECVKEKAEADADAARFGTRLYYNMPGECEAAHGGGNCTLNYSLGGYQPRVIGWQAYRADPDTVIPLYATRDPRIGITSEGEEVPLYQPRRDAKGHVIPEPEGYEVGQPEVPRKPSGEPYPIVAPGMMNR